MLSQYLRNQEFLGRTLEFIVDYILYEAVLKVPRRPHGLNAMALPRIEVRRGTIRLGTQPKLFRDALRTSTSFYNLRAVFKEVLRFICGYS